VKEIALSLIIGTPIIIGISALISFEYWWLWTFFSIFALMIFINMVYPTLIAPIFNKMSKLENSELESEIETLLKRVGFKSSGVFVMDASKRDSRLNAYFGGFGKTKRVVLFDTLVEKLQNRELLAVLGHELGHFKNGDIYKNIGMVGFLLFSIFYVLGNIPTELFETLKLEESPQIFIAFFVLFSPLFSLFIMPLFGYISRKNEYGADEVGSELAGSPLYLKEALKKLVTENKHFPNSHYLYIFFYYTHPPLAERFEALENLK
jgi:STE24 endopeptidase